MRLLFLALFLVLLPLRASADWHLLELDSVYADYNHYIQPTFNPYFAGEEKDGLSLNLNSTVAKYGFLDTTVHGTSNESQYQYMGLYLEVGVRLSSYLDVSVWHHSEHTLDGPDSWGRHFAVEDAVKFRVYFFRNDRPNTILP